MLKANRGFSFGQILAIFVVLAVLVGLSILIFKPGERLKRTRDLKRVADLKALNTALNLYLGNHNFKNLHGPFSSIDPATKAADRSDTHGAGWLPLDLAALPGLPFQTLPLDPLNDINYHYTVGVSDNNTYELNCSFESADNEDLAAHDGGSDARAYELGPDLTIL